MRLAVLMLLCNRSLELSLLAKPGPRAAALPRPGPASPFCHHDLGRPLQVNLARVETVFAPFATGLFNSA